MIVTQLDLAADPQYEDGKVALKVDGLDAPMRNVIRHALMADVPVQACDNVTFHAWDGRIESSMIAHRVGGIPIRGLDPLEFTIKVAAPDNKPLTWVTSLDIKGDDGRCVHGDAEDGIQLVPLLAGQQVHLVCKTSLGTGRKGTLWHSTHVVVQAAEEGTDTATYTLLTTGALTATEAWRRAISSSMATFEQIMAL